MAKKAWEARIPEEIPHKIAVNYAGHFELTEEVMSLDAIYRQIRENDCHSMTDTECGVCIDEQKEYRRLYNDIMRKGQEF